MKFKNIRPLNRLLASMYKIYSASDLGFYIDWIWNDPNEMYAIDPHIYQQISNFGYINGININLKSNQHQSKRKKIVSWFTTAFTHIPIYNRIILKYTYNIIKDHIHLSISATTYDALKWFEKEDIKNTPQLTSHKI